MIRAVAALFGRATCRVTLYDEEFGFGGQSIGRAYDASEFSSQRGIASSAEIYYYGFTNLSENWSPTPFIFYDVATLSTPHTNNKQIQVSSTGFGAKLNFYTNLSSSLTIAFPLQQDIGTPTYGSNRAPRILVQLGYNFN